jgi:hydrogenase maturation factor HypF (carbamoyltransferase family)
MGNLHEHEVANAKVRVRCGECRTTFHERLSRIIRAERVHCPTCRNEMRFRGIDHIHQHEDIAAYIRHVEARTNRPHF